MSLFGLLFFIFLHLLIHVWTMAKPWLFHIKTSRKRFWYVPWLTDRLWVDFYRYSLHFLFHFFNKRGKHIRSTEIINTYVSAAKIKMRAGNWLPWEKRGLSNGISLLIGLVVKTFNGLIISCWNASCGKGPCCTFIRCIDSDPETGRDRCGPGARHEIWSIENTNQRSV